MQKIMWHKLDNLDISDSQKMTADISMEEDSPWFSGHFPDNPALPGIAQLSMILALIEKGKQQAIHPLAIKRTKFMRIVRPGDRLGLFARPLNEDPDTYEFEIKVNDGLSCKGIIRIAAAHQATR